MNFSLGTPVLQDFVTHFGFYIVPAQAIPLGCKALAKPVSDVVRAQKSDGYIQNVEGCQRKSHFPNNSKVVSFKLEE